MNTKMNELLLATLNNYYSFSSSSFKLIQENCKFKELHKEDFLSQERKPNGNEYFLLKGILHRYLANEDGEIVTTDFYLERSVITPHFARTINGKNIFNIQALTDIIYAEIPVVVFDSLRYSYDEIRAFGLKVVEQELQKTMASEIAYRSLSAKDRLLEFRDRYPNLENLIPHTVIASFLGITPVSFSRLRNELAR